ncbi:MAG: hypothetical protein WAV05_13950, partial [Anaerolineales bacterium]
MAKKTKNNILIYIIIFLIIFMPIGSGTGKNNNIDSPSSDKKTEINNQTVWGTQDLTIRTELFTLHTTWKYINFNSLPLPRIGFSLTLNPINNVAILFGGLNSTIGEMNDLWMTDGFEWIQLQTPNSPSTRVNSSMAFDEARKGVVLFGGNDNGILLGDTWFFTGIDWILKNPVLSPSPRTEASIAYDPDQNLVILFGGQGDTGGGQWEALGDMWTWDGVNWEQKLPTHLPPPRLGANMAYDKVNHVMLLFGGGVGGGLLNDTWTWDGSDWIEQQPQHRPPVRADFGMAYDENKQVIIIYGGQGAPNNAIDTWEWIGNDWEQIQTIQSPPEQLSY